MGKDLVDLIYEDIINKCSKNDINHNNFYKIELPLFFIETLDKSQKKKLTNKLLQNTKIKNLFSSITDKNIQNDFIKLLSEN